ncbi:MFS transporter [Ureibacillus sp. Re31]|uniref:MFS transporter n=1 Tax=Ureibacillus galli TaxID=2762222 RepID=A0ABR8X9G9_9BACL|nr:MFS transporter [Ureibacillus galli]MBD8025966.1 MFS transporter [Ureibacillus galli]
MNQELRKQGNEKLLIVMMLTVMLSSMSILLFNFVLPQISTEFQLTNSQVSWVTSGYTLLYGIGTAIYGKLADRYKLKTLLIFGLSLFAMASLLGFFSNSYWLLIVARCLQATGAATIPAISTLVPIRYFPVERRGTAIGTVFIGTALGSAIGPIVSALVVSVVDWRWLFCIPLLLLFTLPFYLKYLGDEKGTQTSIDWLGGGLLALTVAQVLLGVTNNVTWFVGGVVAFILFIYRIRLAKNPFVQPGLFKNKIYTSYLVLAFVITGIGFSLFFLTPLFLAEVQNLPVNLIGLAMVPAAIATALFNRHGGKIADSKGTSTLFIFASSLLILCFFLLSTFIHTNALLISLFLIIGNVGQSFMMIVMSKSISLTLPMEHSGVGMGMVMMQNFIAGSIAVGVYGKAVDMEGNSPWNPLNQLATGATFSNIFFVLLLLHVIILTVYIVMFKRKKGIEA